jgi:hypothetical protein
MADYATLLRDHITLTCRSIDRIFLQAYVPKLQSVGQVCVFLHRRQLLGHLLRRGEAPIAALVARGMTNRQIAAELALSESTACRGSPLLRCWAAKSRPK